MNFKLLLSKRVRAYGQEILHEQLHLCKSSKSAEYLQAEAISSAHHAKRMTTEYMSYDYEYLVMRARMTQIQENISESGLLGWRSLTNEYLALGAGLSI